MPCSLFSSVGFGLNFISPTLISGFCDTGTWSTIMQVTSLVWKLRMEFSKDNSYFLVLLNNPPDETLDLINLRFTFTRSSTPKETTVDSPGATEFKYVLPVKSSPTSGLASPARNKY